MSGSGSGTNEYIRQVLHHAEPPPPIDARFFYTSPIPIDDPLSPLPPPQSGKVPLHQPPKPFSEYDNIALDKAWNALRRKILKFNEERGEKSTVVESSSGGRARGLSSSRRDGGKRGSETRDATPRTRQERSAASGLSQVEGALDDLDLEEDVSGLDGPHNAAEVAALPDTTGTPFIRAPSRKKISEPLKPDDQAHRPKMQAHDTYQWDDSSHLVEHTSTPEARETSSAPTMNVAVGISRLHQVEMPELVMQPIYWVPVHDTAQVVRGTWFYQDTMLPVESDVANMLEAGYVELQVWTETWKDELSSAVEVGAVGEMKVVHQLWPEKASTIIESRPVSRRGVAMMEESLLRTATANLVQAEPDTPEQVRQKAVDAACDVIDIATGSGGTDNKAAGVPTYGRQGPPRHYVSHGVIYANEREARILKPNLLPSTYYGRRPLANYIRKGAKLGIPVVRGFDQAVWDKLHPSKHSKKADQAEQGVATSSAGAPPNVRRKTDPDLAKAERPQVSDLVLVIHGIGQKLSQRMESFNFTHAMNAFRRDVNVEVGTKEVKARFREGMGSIMVLPVNWRQSLSFEEGGYQDGLDQASDFTLRDITPPMLPSVRNIVSDVMLDIPYYMSHHQSSMIAAVTSEANRVYQLWCRNNPGFAENGRVHIIAHSLGSVMAIDILSRQPTTIPSHLSDPTTVDLVKSPLDHFLFPTTNLFLAGSPAGFFLLLQRAHLLPRLDNPLLPPDDPATTSNPSICGSQGTYGCLAVANIYNIVNGYDPVACLMNAAVDAPYAASLKAAHIPSASSSWFGSTNTTSKDNTSWFAGSGSITSSSNAPPLPRLPSNVELETHDFTREEVAEKRMFLLNDNGQIDYFVRYGGGVLDIQYLNMLSAHSSYWLLKDFTRMVVSEIGRPPGRQGTLFGVRAVKRKKALVP